MPIKFACPGCGKQYVVPDEMAGKRANCPCGTKIPVPAPGPAASGSAEGPNDDPLGVGNVSAAPAGESAAAPAAAPTTAAVDPLRGAPAGGEQVAPSWGGASATKGATFSKKTFIMSCVGCAVGGLVLGILIMMLFGGSKKSTSSDANTNTPPPRTAGASGQNQQGGGQGLQNGGQGLQGGGQGQQGGGQGQQNGGQGLQNGGQGLQGGGQGLQTAGSSAAVPVTAEQVILSMDKDGDGAISNDEATDDLKQGFQFFDANKDGAIDLKEAVAVADYVNKEQAGSTDAAPAQVTAEQVIRVMDKDGDGAISKDEAPDDVKAGFLLFDLNKDGMIDLKEAEALAVGANKRQDAINKKQTPGEGNPGTVRPGS